jgi:hypothetical protein
MGVRQKVRRARAAVLAAVGVWAIIVASQCTPLTELCAPQEVSFGFFSKGDCALTRASFFQGHEWLTFFGNEELPDGDRFTEEEVLQIAEGNRRVDWPRELLVHMNNSIVAYADALTAYTEAPENQKLHFLLTDTNGSEEAAQDSIDEMRRLTVEALELWTSNRSRALFLVGRVNHILQDSFSHAHAVRDPDDGWCIRKVKAYIRRAPGYDTPDIEYHGAKDDTVGHATSADSIYREGRDCHEPDSREEVEECLSEEAQRARFASREYLALVRRASRDVLQATSGTAYSATEAERRELIEEIVDEHFEPYVADHFGFCE